MTIISTDLHAMQQRVLWVEIHGARQLPGQMLVTRGIGKKLAPFVMAIVPVWASLVLLWE
jgi:hypothetical protein